MAVIDKDFVKTMFPEWEKFCTIKDDTLTADERIIASNSLKTNSRSICPT